MGPTEIYEDYISCTYSWLYTEVVTRKSLECSHPSGSTFVAIAIVEMTFLRGKRASDAGDEET